MKLPLKIQNVWYNVSTVDNPLAHHWESFATAFDIRSLQDLFNKAALEGPYPAQSVKHLSARTPCRRSLVRSPGSVGKRFEPTQAISLENICLPRFEVRLK
ncbi:unnamed protein product [Albugo candida]|uniref:Uncharacterized protein n=1 Tax=Albugo candida TaxID=65357 RepID=A0A024FVN8_9STRA|nr:unnamed protein product [Albugo candida]|eukprot:CCI11086.1 unnamed protein product [Albugo candida]